MTRVIFHAFATTLLTLLGSAVAVAGGGDIEERRPMQEGARLDLTNVSGNVGIVGWRRQELEVIGEIGDGVERVQIESDGRNFRIEVIQRRSQRRSAVADLEIRVPETTRLNVSTVSADLSVEQVRGAQRLQTVSGDLETELWGEEAEIKTVSGDIEIQGHRERALLTLTSVSGDIDLVGVAGEIVGNTVSGDVDIEEGEFSRLRLRSVSGDIDVRGIADANLRVDAESINGDIRLELDDLFDAEYSLESFHGSISPLFGFEAQRKSRYAPGSQLRITEGSGARRIRVETMNGDIDIEWINSPKRKPNVRHATAARDHGDEHDDDHGRYDRHSFEREMEALGEAMGEFGERLGEDIGSAMEHMSEKMEADMRQAERDRAQMERDMEQAEREAEREAERARREQDR